MALLRANIVLAGAWNPAILTPPWMCEHHIIEDTQVDVQLSMQPPSVTYTSGGFRWNARTDRLMVEAEDVALWSQCADFAVAVLDKLPHTPLSALGVNFVFDQSAARALDVPGQMSASVATHLKGEIVEEIHIVRVRQEGWTMNLKSAVSTSDPVLDFNFHCEVVNPEDVRAGLDSAQQLHKRALDVVRLITHGRQP